MEHRIRDIAKEKCYYAFTSEYSISYISKDKAAELHPNGDFPIFADLKKRVNKEAKDVLVNQDMKIGLYPYKKTSPFTKTIGYIPVENELGEIGYIRILSTIRYRWLFVIFSIALLIFVFLGGIWFAEKDEIPNLDKAAVSYHAEGMKNTDPASIALPGIGKLKAKTDSTLIKSPLINPDGNECYFRYQIQLNDNHEVIYESGWLKPGTALMEFHLKRTLKKGMYEIKVKVATRDLKDHTKVLNGGIIDAKLEVSE